MNRLLFVLFLLRLFVYPIAINLIALEFEPFVVVEMRLEEKAGIFDVVLVVKILSRHLERLRNMPKVDDLFSSKVRTFTLRLSPSETCFPPNIDKVSPIRRSFVSG